MKQFVVQWSEVASKDLQKIIDYILIDNIDTALNIFNKIKTKCKTLRQLPHRGRVVPELKANGILVYHELIIAPWRVIYRISGKKVYILAVIDSRRNTEDILLERLLE